MAVPGLDRRVAELLKHIHHQHTDERLVIDHQDGLALGRMRHCRQLGLGFGTLCIPDMAWQIQADGRALPNLRIDTDLAARLPRKPVNH